MDHSHICCPLTHLESRRQGAMRRGDYYQTDKIVQKGWQYTIVNPKPQPFNTKLKPLT